MPNGLTMHGYTRPNETPQNAKMVEIAVIGYDAGYEKW